MKKQCLVRALSETLTLASTTTSSFTRSLCSSTSSSSTFAPKNVTKSNFESALSDLRRLVRDAGFVSIDLEMTGVTSAPWRESFEFDRFDIRYLKVKDSAEKFAVVQFGVCPFRWDSSKQSFIAHPRQQDEALRHLQMRYEDDLSELYLREARDTALVRIADVLFTERMKNRISEWREGLLQSRNSGSKFQESTNDFSQQFQTIFFKMRPALLLNGFTSHQLRLIQLVTVKHFENLVYIRVKGESSSVQQLIVYTESNNDRGLLMKEVKDGLRKEEEMKIEAAVGFRHVIDLLSSEQKLIVGHNCFLGTDITFELCSEVLFLRLLKNVSSVHKYFPYIIDTKVLLNANDVLRAMMKKGSTSLSKAFAFFCPEIASSVEGSRLGLKPHVNVEVQVDDMNFTSPFIFY